MSYRRGQADMSHPLPAHFGLDDFHPALLADNSSMLHPFVFAAIAFIIFGGAKDLSTEEPILLRFESPVVNGLRLLHLSMGPRLDLFWRGYRDPDGIITNRTFPLLKE
jgi:hypothetical protein